jgi:hypothetical protein
MNGVCEKHGRMETSYTYDVTSLHRREGIPHGHTYIQSPPPDITPGPQDH